MTLNPLVVALQGVYSPVPLGVALQGLTDTGALLRRRNYYGFRFGFAGIR
jgi:hypothetical protein